MGSKGMEAREWFPRPYGLRWQSESDERRRRFGWARSALLSGTAVTGSQSGVASDLPPHSIKLAPSSGLRRKAPRYEFLSGFYRIPTSRGGRENLF